MNQSDSDFVVLKPGRERPIVQRHPWIFSGAIKRIPSHLENGAVVDVVDDSGEWLARGYLNRTSQIQVRLLTWDRSEVIDSSFWRNRLAASIGRRAALHDDPNTTAFRLINGENDYLPGLIVDQYGPYLVVQIGTLGIERHKQLIAGLLLEQTGARSAIERSDIIARRHEGLEMTDGLLAGEPLPNELEVLEHGKRFRVDLAGGQKTGFFLDQRENRRRIATYCEDARVLNAFSYTCAFAVYALAAGAAHVTNIDTSYEALVLGEQNLRLNEFDPDTQCANIAGDVFQVLRDWRDQGTPSHQFDMIILDPPKFAQSRRHLDNALRGYKDINLLALQLLPSNGYLATFSCSGLVSADLFQKVLFGAAIDAGRDVQIVEWYQQACDHPTAITFPEGRYLTGLLCRVL